MTSRDSAGEGAGAAPSSASGQDGGAPVPPPVIDPRHGDFEDDASSPKQRSTLRIAGSLLAEVSLPKLAIAWLLLVALPGVVFGLAPLVLSIWFSTLSRVMILEVGWIVFAVLLVAVGVLGLFAGRQVFRLVESTFWGLNSIVIQPAYALVREAIRHVAVARGEERRGRLQRVAAVGAGVVVCLLGLLAADLAWPSTRWTGTIADLRPIFPLVLAAIANTVFAIGVYVAVAAPVWGIADALLGSPRDLPAFDPAPADGRTWRVAHLSDVHVVGEQYGFRIESGRGGAQGNERLYRTLDRLAALDAEHRLDLIVITGDATDAGRSAEWVDFLAALNRHPRLAGRILLIPGNHDLNVVDRANPARLELPASPYKVLRQMRMLSALAAVQGDRVRLMAPSGTALGKTLSAAISAEAGPMADFADVGSRRLARRLGRLWEDAFPMVVPPDKADGLGVILLNSVAETHFSFTNALGFIDAEQARKLVRAARLFPGARWIVALHHHLVEYPSPAHSFSERIGTALVNGSWFVRQLQPLADRLVALHGHRHVDWIGECGGVRIVSAPSPVMRSNDEPTHFYILTFAAGAGGRLSMLAPERIDLPGDGAAANREGPA